MDRQIEGEIGETGFFMPEGGRGRERRGKRNNPGNRGRGESGNAKNNGEKHGKCSINKICKQNTKIDQPPDNTSAPQRKQPAKRFTL